MVCAILVEGIMRNTSVKLYFGQVVKEMSFKVNPIFFSSSGGHIDQQSRTIFAKYAMLFKRYFHF